MVSCSQEALDNSSELVCVALSQSNLTSIVGIFSVLSSIAIILTAVFAWWQIRSARKGARLTATINLLTQIQTNPTWSENRLKFIKIRESNKIREHAHQQTEEAQCVRLQLNQYELIALGVSLGIVDKETYRRYFRTTIIRDWTECHPFIVAERRENLPYWTELERLIADFKTEPTS